MGDWPLTLSSNIQTVGQNYASSRGTTVTASASANVKGAWSQIVASTPIAAKTIIIDFRCSLNGGFLVDVGIGASTVETVIIANLIAARFQSNSNYSFPISIPAGSRISARAQATTGSDALFVLVMLLSHGFAGTSFSRVTGYGVATADSGATQVDPGATANTKQAW